jgi:phage terminase small subunit
MFEMNEEQTKCFEALTPLQKEVSLNSISGMNDIDAYKASRGRAKNENTMRATVSEILINPNVKAFIKSMASHVVNPAVMSRQEMIEKLSALSRVDVSDISKVSIEELTEFKGGYDVKLKAIHTSMKQLAELAGYEAPKQVEILAKEELTPWGKITAASDE